MNDLSLLTGQGVRNLNGPRMDGRHNGRTVKHPHTPMTPYYTQLEMRGVAQASKTLDDGTVLPSRSVEKMVAVRYCSFCSQELSNSED